MSGGYVAVFTLGLSPPIAVEFLLSLSKRDVDVDRAVAVTTRGALPSFHALKLALYWSSKVESFPDLTGRLQVHDFSHINLTLRQLTMDDIVRPEDCKAFRTQFHAALRTAVKWAGGNRDRVYVCVAGGRKTMPIDATLISIAEDVRSVYHVVAPKIPGIATEFANLVSGRRESIELNGETVQRDALLRMLAEYSEHPERADEGLARYVLKLCFPPRELEFHLVRIPIPRLTPDERRRFRGEVLP